MIPDCRTSVVITENQLTKNSKVKILIFIFSTFSEQIKA